jgi:hypothetical protein
MVCMPVIPSNFHSVAFECDLAHALVTPENRQFLHMGEAPLVVFPGPLTVSGGARLLSSISELHG